MASTSEPASSPEIESEQLIRHTSKRRTLNPERSAQIGESSRPASEVPPHLVRCSTGASSSQVNPTLPSSVRHEGVNTELTPEVLSQEEDRFVPLGFSIEDIDPLYDHEGRIGGKKSSSSTQTVNDMLNSCGLFNSNVTILIPREDQRPWNPPEGYICLYEGYFTECRLLFPIPELISLYAQRRRIAICQFVAGAICNFMAALTVAAEVGVNIGNKCFEQLSSFKLSKSLHRWEVNMRPAHNFLAGKKVNKFKKYVDHYFYVCVDQYSLANPLDFQRKVWNENPDRPFCATRLAPNYLPVRDALLTGNNRRWEFITRIPIETAMGKARTNFPSFASSLGRSTGCRVVEPKDLQIVRRDTQAAIEAEIGPSQGLTEVDPTPDQTVADPIQTPGEDVEPSNVAEGDTLPLALENADPPNEEQDVPQLEAGSKRRKKKKKNKDKQIRDEPATDARPLPNRKRSAEEAGLESADRFRLERKDDKTNHFAYYYFGNYPLVTNREASGELFRTLKTSSRILPSADELEFKQAFLDVAESHLMTAAKMNTLTQLYDRRVKTNKGSELELKKVKECAEEIRVASRAKDERIKELEALIAEKDGIIANSELRISELNSRTLTLEEEKVELQESCDGLQVQLNFEVKRLRWDRWEKVERTAKKAQTRLDKVKAYLVEQAKVRPLEDLLNQATGVQEAVQYLIENGAVIPEERIKEIDEKKAEAEDTIKVIDVLELNENDLGMSPDQLGDGFPPPETTALESVEHPFGLNAESFQADLTGALLKAKRKRTTDLLDESEQKARALETHSEDWEKTGLQLLWPMPKRLKTSIREIVANGAPVWN
ncbi:PREDICTED: uncharacterized protein At3g60930, chloroplastic-like [Camelina sativa]|uniref:Uncharacterized protein At3g60930, chloroplastic-like n=1 Tax=Camelina sativa TaxID=90675 RepID=A0ABM1RPA5_CAMSA|nr:PREDICTED: uncharacterized protein At3g60930, chloroplastic-like [Camelina sativa]